MTSLLQDPQANTTATFERRQPNCGQETVMTVCAMWLIGELLLDNWAHTNKDSLESFWTPWHAVMYAGGGACVAALGWMMYRNVILGASLRDSIPLGYEPVAAGAVLLGISGVGDMIWHTVFGIERD